MFNLKRKVAQVADEIKQSFETSRDRQEVITEIHESFDSATDRILKEAQDILANIRDTNKGERLLNLGFVNAAPSVEATNEVRKRKHNKYVAECVEYFRQHYPNNKFITETEVETICKKYRLVCAFAYFYKGDVPEKNIKEIESFKLRFEDETKSPIHEYTDKHGYKRRTYLKTSLFRKWGEEHSAEDNGATEVSYKEPLKICAPLSDFNTEQMEIKDGYSLQMNIPDPIVLQPVKGGYLILTKWGLEASDEIVINQINN